MYGHQEFNIQVLAGAIARAQRHRQLRFHENLGGTSTHLFTVRNVNKLPLHSFIAIYIPIPRKVE